MNTAAANNPPQTIDVKNVQKKIYKTLKNVINVIKIKKRLKTLDKKRSSPIHNA